MVRRAPFVLGFIVSLTIVLMASGAAYANRLPAAFYIFPNTDFVAHAIGYAAVAFFAGGLVASSREPSRRRLARFMPLLVLLIAATEEFLQRLSPFRSSSLSDLTADILGVSLATLLLHWMLVRSRSLPSRTASRDA